MSEFDYKEDEVVAVGLEKFEKDTRVTIVGLEALREKVVRVGMSKSIYAEGEQLSPGVFKNINPRTLTHNFSTTKKAVAVESIDTHAAKLVGAGAVAALAAGGVGTLIYKFVKWVKSKLSKGAGDMTEETLESAESKVDGSKVKAQTDKKVESGKSKASSIEKGEAKRILDGLSDPVSKVGYYFAYAYGTSIDESVDVLKAISKSSLAKSDADTACLFVNKAGLPMAVLGAVNYKIDEGFVNEAYKYLGHVLKAFQAMGKFMADPRDATAADVIAAAKGLGDANSHGSRVMVAIEEFGTDKAALFEGRVGYAHAIDPGRVKYHPDQSEVKRFVEMITSQGYNDVCSGVANPYGQIKKMLEEFESSGVKLDKEITEADISEANEKAKTNEGLKKAVKDIQKSVSNALKLKQVLNRYINSVATLKEQLKR